jgi:hypothetical protein
VQRRSVFKNARAGCGVLASFALLLEVACSPVPRRHQGQPRLVFDEHETSSAKRVHGVFPSSRSGQRLSDVTARMSAAGDRLVPGSAALEGLRRRAGQVRVTIALRDARPITVEGVERRLQLDLPRLSRERSFSGETATETLSQALEAFARFNISARVDTTKGSARPELVLRLSPRVSAKVSRALGAPAAGERPDRTFLTVELHLRRSWALAAVIGDRGASGLGLIWRRAH